MGNAPGLAEFISMFVERGGGTAIGYTALLVMWWITWKDSLRKDRVIEEKDRQLLELTEKSVAGNTSSAIAMASVEKALSSMYAVLTSPVARK